MKQIISLSAFLLLFSGLTSAQGIYIRSGTGYGLPIATTDIGENYLHAATFEGNNYIDKYSTEVVSASYGAGANFNVAFGYKFNENLILDFNVIYLAGKKYETSYRYTYTDTGYSSLEEDISTTHSKGLLLNPSIIFSAGFGKGAPYARFGLIGASPKIIEDLYYFGNSDGEYTRDIRWEYSGGMAIGYQTAIGMNWRISDRLDLYSETTFVSMTYYAKEGVMTEYLENGIDYLDQAPLSFTRIEYKKEYDPSQSYDESKPLVQLREARAFSYISAQVGIRFTILKLGD